MYLLGHFECNSHKSEKKPEKLSTYHYVISPCMWLNLPGIVFAHCKQSKTGQWWRPGNEATANLPNKVYSLNSIVSFVPRPHLQERVWWYPADTSGFINIDYFLERNISPPITLQKRQSVVQHRKFLASSARWHSTFLARKLVIGSQLCIQQAMNF